MKRVKSIGHRAQGTGQRAKSQEQSAGARGLFLFADHYFATLRLCATMNNKPQQFTLGGSKYRTIPCLPRGGFNSGVCPGAAAITILYTYTGGPRGTLGGSHTPAVTNSLTLTGQPAELFRSLAEGDGHKIREGPPMI
jgi:hypothetical protein